MASLLTFSRAKKGARSDASSGGGAGDTACSAAMSATYVTAPSVLTPVAESPASGQDENAAPASVAKPAPRWRRKTAAERAEAERRQHMAEMRAYFQEVDAYELAVETPPPARAEAALAPSASSPPRDGRQPGIAQALAAAAPTPGTALRQRPMSLGLSRRRSSMAPWAAHTVLASATKAQPSPLKLAVPRGAAEGHLHAPRCSTMQPSTSDVPHRLSVAADNASLASPGGWAPNRRSLATHRRRSSVAPSRLSSTGGALSRLSLGLSDALQWLGIRGKIPTAAVAERPQLSAAAAAPSGGAAVAPARPALSPIASPGGEEEDGTAAEQSPLPAGAVAAAEEPVAQAAQGGDADAGEEASAAPATAADTSKEEAPMEAVEQQLAALLLQDAAAMEATAMEAAAAAPGETQAVEPAEAAAPPATLGELSGAAEVEEELTPLQQLLVLCGQETDAELLPSMGELLGRHVDLAQVRKIGEGTFGEAFKAGGVVLKLVPMEGDTLVNGEPQKRADEILAEVSVTLTLSRLNGSDAVPGEQPANVTSGFVETFGVGVCRGAYAEALRREWHRWDEEHGSENEEVDIFGADQLYVVFVVADGGADLEHFELRSFAEVRSILLQTVLAVAVAEESCEFEHRDLHWGNLLIRRSEEATQGAAVRARLRGVELEAPTEGVTVTLIDFTLSRLVTVTGEVAFCDLAADPELFKGPKNSVQAETYRRMKKATKNNWRSHVPATNVFWMQYLVDICMTEKKGWTCRKEEVNALRAFKRRVLTYPSCSAVLLDEFLREGLVIGGDDTA